MPNISGYTLYNATTAEGFGIVVGKGIPTVGWTPLTPASNVYYFDSRFGLPRGIINGGEVATWADQGNNGLNLVEVTADTVFYAAQPPANFIPAVKFSGAPAQGMENATTPLVAGGARTILTIGQTLGTGTQFGGIITAIRTGNDFQASCFVQPTPAQGYHGDLLTYGGLVTPPTTAIGNLFSSAHVYTGAGNVPTLFVNGVQLTTDATPQGTENGPAGFSVGCGLGSASYCWNGYLWVVAAYNIALPPADLANFHSFAQNTFGCP